MKRFILIALLASSSAALAQSGFQPPPVNQAPTEAQIMDAFRACRQPGRWADRAGYAPEWKHCEAIEKHVIATNAERMRKDEATKNATKDLADKLAK